MGILRRPNDDNILENLHKDANFRVVVPTMGVVGTAFILVHFQPTEAWFLAIGLGGLAVLSNAWYVTFNPVWRWRGRTIALRTDRGDAIRWTLNFIVADVPVMVLIEPDKIPMFGMWTLLIFSSFFDIYRNRYRLPVTFFGLLSSLLTLLYIYPSCSWIEAGAWTTAIACILMFFFYVERIWLSEAMRRLTAQEREQHTAMQAERLHRKAILGEHARTIAHEVSNLTMAINLAVYNPANINVAAIRRSSDYLKHLAHLVLEDVKATPMIRKITVGDLLSDVNVLLRKQVEMQDIDWSVTTEPQSIADESFQERSGSTYFILQNLIRNAIEAINQHTTQQRGQIIIAFNHDQFGLSLAIQDNGVGMSSGRVRELLNGQAETTKREGHGLGMRFVLQELRRNHFTISIDSQEGVGTKICVHIPLAGSSTKLPTPDSVNEPELQLEEARS